MSSKPLVASAALSVAFALLLAAPASAHKQSLKLSIGPLFGNTSPVQIKKAGALSITGFGGGTVILTLKNIRDANSVKMNVFGNQLRMDLRVNGVPTSVAFPFNIKNGKGTLRTVIHARPGPVQGRPRRARRRRRDRSGRHPVRRRRRTA
jgi:hypothetical protein